MCKCTYSTLAQSPYGILLLLLLQTRPEEEEEEEEIRVLAVS
jgi:hypothetical protein